MNASQGLSYLKIWKPLIIGLRRVIKDEGTGLGGRRLVLAYKCNFMNLMRRTLFNSVSRDTMNNKVSGRHGKEIVSPKNIKRRSEYAKVSEFVFAAEDQ